MNARTRYCCAWFALVSGSFGTAFCPRDTLGRASCQHRRRKVGVRRRGDPASSSSTSTITCAGFPSRGSCGSGLRRVSPRYEAGSLEGDIRPQTCSPSSTTSSSSRWRAQHGMYRSIADNVWNKLTTNTSWQAEPPAVPSNLLSNVAPTKGMKDFVTRIETRALKGKCAPDSGAGPSPIGYARMALIETVPIDDAPDENERAMSTESNAPPLVHTKGIQVLNVVIFPRRETSLPIWGADFVSLPGDKHLILLDAQPVDAQVRTSQLSSFDAYWHDWYQRHGVASRFPWGGDLPDRIKPFVSSNALWTRFTPPPPADANEDVPAVNPIDTILTDLPHIVESHLDIYLGLLNSEVDKGVEIDLQSDYIRYRRDNDPARPMLKALYGEEWTESVLSNVLFPQYF